jgi:hypothetical protein
MARRLPTVKDFYHHVDTVIPTGCLPMPHSLGRMAGTFRLARVSVSCDCGRIVVMFVRGFSSPPPI